MNVIPPPTPADLGYLQESPIADLLSVVPLNQSFMSLLMGSDPDLSSPATTLDLGVKSQSTHQDSSSSSVNSQSDLWSSEEEESNYLASLGLGVTGSVEVENSWSMMEDQMLRAAMADNRVMEQSIIHWECIAEALPWRTPLEVFNRTNHMLQTIHRDLSTVIMSQQHQQPMPPPPHREEEKRQQQQIRRVRKRWSKQEDDKFRVGVERYGWGNWKMVASLIPGRTVPQFTSHAQHQHYIRKQHPMPKRIHL